MRKFITIILSICFTVAIAQDNDTSVIRSNNVASVHKMQFVHAFVDNIDTCLLDIKEYDTLFQLTYHKKDMACMGWSTNEEVSITYQNKGIATLEMRKDNNPFSRSTYNYGGGSDPTSILTYFYQTKDSMFNENIYFKNKDGRLDSSFTTATQPNGTKYITKSYARYNEDGDIVQYYTTDENKKPLQMMSYEMSDKGRMVSVAQTMYGEKPTFNQTFYEYNQNGQIANTLNTTNQKQEYFYDKNGLLINVLAYNPKGVLEIEYIFVYTYH